MRGACIFFTGLSGAGKTTLAVLLRGALTTEDRYITLVDGDAVRALSDVKLTFSKEHRDLNVRRVGFLAKEIVRHGGIVICALIAPYEEVRQEIERSISEVGSFFLVHVATPLEECERRDVKGLYIRVRAGEIEHFTGIDDPYEEPTKPHLVIDTTNRTPEGCLRQLQVFLKTQAWDTFK